MIYLYHHLGLGDHIICNALVRIFSKRFDRLFLFCKHHNYESVRFMYSDLQNIDFISVADDLEADRFILENRIFRKTIRVGFDQMYSTGSKNFDESFYMQFGIDFDSRWSEFHVPRNIEREKALFDRFGLSGKKYIFVHDDARFSIDMKMIEIDPQTIIVRPDRDITENIFDYLTIIENASQIHAIESSFMFIIDSLNIDPETVYAHRYPRKQGYMETPVYKNIKKIIT